MKSRRSVRLGGYDYSRPGIYFITICTYQHECLFGTGGGGRVVLNELGRIVEQEWRRSAEIRREIELDSFSILPDHIHGIVHIKKTGKWQQSGKGEGERPVGSIEKVGATGGRPYLRSSFTATGDHHRLRSSFTATGDLPNRHLSFVTTGCRHCFSCAKELKAIALSNSSAGVKGSAVRPDDPECVDGAVNVGATGGRPCHRLPCAKELTAIGLPKSRTDKTGSAGRSDNAKCARWVENMGVAGGRPCHRLPFTTECIDGQDNADTAKIVGATGRSPLQKGIRRCPIMDRQSSTRPNGPRPHSLASFVAGFKASVTSRINHHRQIAGFPIWQRGYYDQIIRNTRQLWAIRGYIRENPSRWEPGISDDY